VVEEARLPAIGSHSADREAGVNNDYADITEKLGTPKWWDEHAVPRYCDFHPSEVANIYAREVAFLHIECQSCGTAFKVAMSSSGFAFRGGEMVEHKLSKEVEDQVIHYGDPPNYRCCGAGPTMNSIPRRVLEFWSREMTIDLPEWSRREELEVELEVDWADG
jgi:hypothetical protein